MWKEQDTEKTIQRMSCFYTNDVHLKSKWIISKLFILVVSGDGTSGGVLILRFIFSIALIVSLTSVFLL